MKKCVFVWMLCLFLAAGTVFSASADTIVSDSDVDSFLSVAESYIDKSRGEVGIPGTDAWCAHFVGYCINRSSLASKLGQITNHADGAKIARWACKEKGAAVLYCYSKAHYDRYTDHEIAFSGDQIKLVSSRDYMPEPGDILEFAYGMWSEHETRHVGVATGRSGDTVY